MESFSIETKRDEELIDITSDVKRAVRAQNLQSGICCVYTPHTTAGITINENADPDVRRDIVLGLTSLQMEQVSFKHREGNSPAHIKSTIVGCSVNIPIELGSLALGTWQGIFFCEFDGPRNRKVYVQCIGD
jgi:secondary thiamine-phosphate synthase enzyme